MDPGELEWITNWTN